MINDDGRGNSRPLFKENRMSKYFKKPNGVIVEYDEKKYDLKSFQDRFEECNADGSKVEPKAKVKKDDK